MKFLDIGYALAEFHQICKENHCYDKLQIRELVYQIRLSNIMKYLDGYGCVSKGFFYQQFACIIRKIFGALYDNHKVSILCQKFGDWLFISMKDFTHVTLHVWKMNALVKEEYDTSRVCILEDNIDLISGTAFFDNVFFRNALDCTLAGAVSEFVPYADKRDGSVMNTLHTLYIAIEVYGANTRVEFNHESYHF